MLHFETVSPATLDLIRRLQKEPALQGFLLVGGTGLSLQLGHRTSYDIDLFTRNPFDTQTFLETLEKRFHFQLHLEYQNTLKGFIDGIFIDLLRHDYPWVQPHIETDGLFIASKQDIAAMKLNVISGNGTRVKDFTDIYFLLQEFSLEQILGFYHDKYPERNDFHILKSLTYFEDLIPEDWPDLLKEKDLNISKLKQSLITFRDQYLAAQRITGK